MLNMNDTLPINTLSKLIKLRSVLDSISQISWSFSVLNKSHPVGTISTEEEASDLTRAYEDLIEDARALLAKQV